MSVPVSRLGRGHLAGGEAEQLPRDGELGVAVDREALLAATWSVTTDPGSIRTPVLGSVPIA